MKKRFLERLPGADIETNLKDTRVALEATDVDEDEDTIEIALRDMYSSDEVSEIPRSAMTSISRLAITNIHFKCNKLWYNQSDGLLKGVSLTINLANLLMKSFDYSLKKPN